MSLNPGGVANTNWNFSNQERDGYSLELFGTVVAVQEIQAREFDPQTNRPGRPAFWPDGNPKMNLRVAFATPDGSLKSIIFPKAGKAQVAGEKPSLHMQFYILANGMENLVGKTVHIWTWPAHPETNQAWGRGNPRLFGLEEVTDAKYELANPLPHEFTVDKLYANDGVQGGQPVPPSPQQMQVPPPMQGGYFMPPQAQQQYAQMPMQYQQMPQMQRPPMQMTMQPMMNQPMRQQMPTPMPMMQQQPMTAPMPQGMDPTVAAAMQSVGAVNIQPSDMGGGVVYENDDIPF